MDKRRVPSLILAGYGAMLGWVTLAPATRATAGGTPRWLPFVEIWNSFASEGTSRTLVQVGGNIALFIPLGWLIPMIWPSLRSRKRVLLIAAACSTSLELCQLIVPGRSTAASDVILNTLGAFIGAAIFFRARAAPMPGR